MRKQHNTLGVHCTVHVAANACTPSTIVEPDKGGMIRQLLATILCAHARRVMAHAVAVGVEVAMRRCS
jgi:hypothetical protein